MAVPVAVKYQNRRLMRLFDHHFPFLTTIHRGDLNRTMLI
jgi:hypothetical protein